MLPITRLQAAGIKLLNRVRAGAVAQLGLVARRHTGLTGPLTVIRYPRAADFREQHQDGQR